MKYCYKDNCPENTEEDESVSKSIYKICISGFPYFKIDIQNYVNFCSIYELLDKSCIINYKIGNYLGNISSNVETIIYNESLLQNEQIIILGNNIVYEIITSYIDINKRNIYNLSYINFGECENLLKEFYNIDYLLIFKYEV
jgi:hypothetical protein